MLRRTVFLAWFFALAAGTSLAQIRPEERIPVTDPRRLRDLGFPSDARNVFLWSRADPGARGAITDKTDAPETWGTAVGFSTLHASDLEPRLTDIVLSRLTSDTFCYDSAGLEYPDAFGQIQAPEGASLGVFRSWAFDSDPDQDLTFRIWETCQPYGFDPPANTLVVETSTLGSIGQYPSTKNLNGLVVNNEACAYSVQVVFATPPRNCSGFDLRVQKFQVTWKRQVSPAPLSATFGDVPTSHPFFQFVEALVKSGVTGGCGAGNYCPDSPLTRGQMAVFLAKALGLQWP